MRNPKILWGIIVILLVVVMGAAFKFIVLGSTAKGDDGRIAVVLNKAERNMILEEMRTLLVTVQDITRALANEDMAAIAAAAKPVGSDAIATVDFTLRAKLPLAFKKLGFGTHYAFDDIIAMAEANKPVKEIQLKLVDIMDSCVACHATFQLPDRSED